mmetsp:Transcript_78463/g.227765  ORF Transcript_78463/g.227765 Transcript_78463/m.227765 type:complete len:303 (+) Transcript_78463:55-963(+)
MSHIFGGGGSALCTVAAERPERADASAETAGVEGSAQAERDAAVEARAEALNHMRRQLLARRRVPEREILRATRRKDIAARSDREAFKGVPSVAEPAKACAGRRVDDDHGELDVHKQPSVPGGKELQRPHTLGVLAECPQPLGRRRTPQCDAFVGVRRDQVAVAGDCDSHDPRHWAELGEHLARSRFPEHHSAIVPDGGHALAPREDPILKHRRPALRQLADSAARLDVPHEQPPALAHHDVLREVDHLGAPPYVLRAQCVQLLPRRGVPHAGCAVYADCEDPVGARGDTGGQQRSRVTEHP